MKSLLGFVIPVLFAQVSMAVFLEVRDDAKKMFAILSTEGTNTQAVKGLNLAPRGSAAVTPAGALSQKGINYIIHAAPASMGSAGREGEPTIASIRLSIVNSIRLAEKVGAKSVAIPLIGGGIFLPRLGVSQEELAFQIIDAARSSNTQMKVVFVGYEDAEYARMEAAFNKNKGATANPVPQEPAKLRWWQRLFAWIRNWSIKTDTTKTAPKFFENASVVHGSITDFNAHKSEAIVNAANMELTFGAGLSGFIGQQSRQSADIDAINQALIRSFQSRLK